MQKYKNENCLVLGATGSIGSALIEGLHLQEFTVWRVARSLATDIDEYRLNLTDFIQNIDGVCGLLPKFSSVVFAQGANLIDDIVNFNKETHKAIYDANVLVILDTVSMLVARDLLVNPASICIVSSIWQDMSRNNKLSYSISKSALKGVVLSLVADLSKKGIRVNAVLPGPIDNPMTRANLTHSQIAQFESESPSGTLSKLSSVVNAVVWLVSPFSDGITGNFIRVDSGASLVRIY
jgi:NAD(P)-dependent dehydrogenase (short-subunit alcohol dehydrogenase family)